VQLKDYLPISNSKNCTSIMRYYHNVAVPSPCLRVRTLIALISPLMATSKVRKSMATIHMGANAAVKFTFCSRWP